MVRNSVLSQKRKRVGTPSASLPVNIPLDRIVLPLTILQNIVIKPGTSGESPLCKPGRLVNDELQRPYLGQNAGANMPDLDAFLPVIHVAEGELSNIDDNTAALLSELEENAISAALGTNGSILDTGNCTKNEANVTNTEDQGAADAAYFFMSSQFSMPAMLSPIIDGYNSEDDFEPKKFKSSSLSSSSKISAKATSPKMGVGSFGKGALINFGNNNDAEPVAKPSKSRLSLHKPTPLTENVGDSILQKMLSGSTSLPAKYVRNCESDPNNLGCTKTQVKSYPGTSAETAGNSAVEIGCSSAVLPAPIVTRAQVHHVVESDVRPTVQLTEPDEEPDVFSQASENQLINNYRLLHNRVKREHAEHLAIVQRSEEDFQRADEAFRLAQEGRRVALDTLEMHRKALNKLQKKLRKFEEI